MTASVGTARAMGSGGWLAGEVPVPDVPDPLRIVAPDGSITDPALFDSLDLGPVELSGLMRAMVVMRDLDEEYVNLQRQGQLALWPPSRGQEAAQVGCAHAIEATDWLFPTYRELGLLLHRGIDVGAIGLMWRGATNGVAGMTERRIAPLSIPIGTQVLHAAGAAMAAQMERDDSIVIAFLGDGATSEGDVHEALNFAGVFGLPCVFFVQNNQWAISTPVTSQTAAPSLAHKAAGYGMPGLRVDGNDVLATLLVTRQAAAWCRSGRGPVLVEAVTYRTGPHTTSDDPSRYRSAEDEAAAAALDPITRFRRFLDDRGLIDEGFDAGTAQESQLLRSALRSAVFDAADPSPASTFDHVTAYPDPARASQRRQLVAELGGGHDG